jgi:PhoH-like ATPase
LGLLLGHMEPVYSGTEGVALVLEEESLRRALAPRGAVSAMKKNYVLDTNVLLYDPQAIFKFEDNDVIIPIYVIEEVDQFKRESTERGRNARTIARLLDGLRTRGSLAQGVAVDTGGSLKIAIPSKRPQLATALDHSAQDQAILQTAIDVRDSNGTPTIFVTMDSNLRIRADALGLAAQTYENVRVEVDQLDNGVAEIDVDGAIVDAFFHEGFTQIAGHDLYPNVCVLLRDRLSPSHSALGRYDANKERIVPLRVSREGVMGIRPRNKEQTYALDLLLDDSIRLVTLVGKAGTGKTLLALAGGLKRTVEDQAYSRLLVSRPVMPLGRDIGYLPGDIEEKLNPWMQPIFDNLEFLFATGGKGREPRGFAELLETGQIQVEPLTYIRGRSLPHQYLIVDEAQNLSPHEVKTIITRCGEGTKIVLTGDPFQIDNPYVDSASNGLTIVADRFKREKLAGHILLSKGERSELAEIAANLL